MSKEKRYEFTISLTEEQTKVIQDTWDECVGIESGEGLVATVGLKSRSLNFRIIPPYENIVMAKTISAMMERTELDDLGIVG